MVKPVFEMQGRRVITFYLMGNLDKGMRFFLNPIKSM